MNNELNQLRESLLGLIEADLRQFTDATCPQKQPQIGEMMRWHMGWEGSAAGARHGKRLRPLFLLLFGAITGCSPHNALPAATAIELIHNFTLVHDDIQDQSDMRHNRAALWTRYGTAQAINTGDLLYSLAKLSLARLENDFPAGIILQIAMIIEQTVFKLGIGQHMDIAFEGSTAVKLADYVEMIAHKTGDLLSASCKIGAVLGPSDSELIMAAGEYGMALGMAFQVQDDILGIWGDPAITGKSNQNDLAMRKLSLPITMGLDNRSRFYECWNSEHYADYDLPYLKDILEGEGAKDYSLEKAAEFAGKATALLPRICRGNNEYGELLSAVTRELIGRSF